MQRAKKYTLEQVAALLPWPDDLANKYSRGKLTLIAGCADYPGAACLAAVASQRMGAGYTEVACSPNPSRRCARQARHLWCARGTSWRRTRSLILMNGGASLAALPRFRLRPQARTGGRARIAHADRAVRCMRRRARKRLVPWRPVIRWRSSSAAA